MSNYQKSPVATSRNHIDEIRELLPGAVLVPVPRNSKNPMLYAWQKISFEQTQEPGFLIDVPCGRSKRTVPYNAELTRGNVAVALGPKSGFLYTIDIDSDEGLEAFLILNAWAKETLITKRKRGGNIWFYLLGEDHRCIPIKTDGDRAWGEFRGNGVVTMIHGQAQDKSKGETAPLPYVRLNDTKPIKLDRNQIVWPEGVIAPALESVDLFAGRTNQPTNLPSSTLLPPYTLTSLRSYITEPSTPLARLRQREEARQRFEGERGGIKNLYENLAEPMFRSALTSDTRNRFLADTAPMLFRNFGEEVSLDIMMYYYFCNQARFQSPPEQHQKEGLAAIRGVMTTYLAELSDIEREFYMALPEGRERDVFRICRTLALCDKPEGKKPLTFFAPSEQIGHRIGLKAMQAWRVLDSFQGLGVLELIEKGQRRAPGITARASWFRWCLATVAAPDSNQVALTE